MTDPVVPEIIAVIGVALIVPSLIYFVFRLALYLGEILTTVPVEYTMVGALLIGLLLLRLSIYLDQRHTVL